MSLWMAPVLFACVMLWGYSYDLRHWWHRRQERKHAAPRPPVSLDDVRAAREDEKMMRWARMTAERIEAICTLEPHQAALALRALLAENAAVARCLSCEAAYDVHGDLGGLDAAQCPACGEQTLTVAL